MTIGRVGRRIRLIAMGYGLALFLWLSVEDNTVWPVTLFGVGLSALMLILTFSDKLSGRQIPMRFLPLTAAAFGGLMGMGTAVATAALMFFKNAVHAHVFLDYPLGLMIAIVQRSFVWAAAGALMALGLVLAWLALRSDSVNHEQFAEEVAEDAS
jgi:hypothetical protein